MIEISHLHKPAHESIRQVLKNAGRAITYQELIERVVAWEKCSKAIAIELIEEASREGLAFGAAGYWIPIEDIELAGESTGRGGRGVRFLGADLNVVTPKSWVREN